MDCPAPKAKWKKCSNQALTTHAIIDTRAHESGTLGCLRASVLLILYLVPLTRTNSDNSNWTAVSQRWFSKAWPKRYSHDVFFYFTFYNYCQTLTTLQSKRLEVYVMKSRKSADAQATAFHDVSFAPPAMSVILPSLQIFQDSTSMLRWDTCTSTRASNKTTKGSRHILANVFYG